MYLKSWELDESFLGVRYFFWYYCFILRTGKNMGVSTEAEAGYGLRLDISDSNLAKPELKDFKKYVWERSEKHTRKYYENVETMFDEDNFDLDSIESVFPDVRFAYCGNPYESGNKANWFAVAKSSFVSLGINEYQDLSAKSSISADALAQLRMLKVISFDETPRWYTWFNLG